nr:MAG: putative RNA-dependent RNA polymerase [Mitoviridae sp.]
MINKIWLDGTDGLFSKPLRMSSLRWQRAMRKLSTMKGLCNRVLLIVFDKLSKETCILSALFCKSVIRLVFKSGPLAAALQLKQAGSCLMMYYGGNPSLHGTLPIPISLTRSGIPTIIPSYHRRIIRMRNDRSDLLVKCYLSFFSLSRIVLLAKKISNKLYKSITSPWRDPERVERCVNHMKTYLYDLSLRYLPRASQIPVYQGISWVPTWKALPSTPLFRESVVKADSLRDRYRKVKSCFPTIFWEMIAYGSLLNIEHANEGLFSSGVLWRSRVRYALDHAYNKLATDIDLSWFEMWVGPVLPTGEQCRLPWLGGRLSFKLDGGGKRRVFAIGNFVKQRLLHPYHVWLMENLRTLRTDGTFDQLKPLSYLTGSDVYYSFDLTAATDRWPLYWLFCIMRNWFGHNLSGSIVNTTLAHNVFSIRCRKGWSSLCFVAGQPLGYYMSWPLFAISHHFVVWYCAEQIYPGRKFEDYAIIGDDIVLSDAKVAGVYSQVLADLGVDISISKSLISHSGCLEFAKRFRIKQGTVDLSPVSMRALMQYSNPYGLLGIHHRYPMARFTTLLRVGGMGYKVLGKYLHTPSRQVRRLKVMFSFPHSDFPLDLWLGGGLPLSPYSKGEIVLKLLHQFRPKELVIAPEELYPSEGVEEMSERTVLRGWMTKWLEYIGWYSMITMRPESPLEDYFDRPIVEVSYKAKMDRSEYERYLHFGVIWSLYSLVCQRSPSWYVPSLVDRFDHKEITSMWVLSETKKVYLKSMPIPQSGLSWSSGVPLVIRKDGKDKINRSL